MPQIRTLITEICTAVGTCSADDAVDLPHTAPSALRNVDSATWDAVMQSMGDTKLAPLARAAWRNGRDFLQSPEGLRGTLPFLVEWKGPHKPPGYEYLPADIRVNHVYLVSCKYGSDILLNTSPANLFDRNLSSRHGHHPADWFHTAAPAAYSRFYGEVLAELQLGGFPAAVGEMTRQQRDQLTNALHGRWPGSLQAAFSEFSRGVAHASQKRWKANLGSRVARETVLWRLLRLADAPYFILGMDAGRRPIQVRVGTPWDWKQHFRLLSFDIHAVDSGQPVVAWTANAEDRVSQETRQAKGHVEIRWSHGRFSGFPEAKVYLDTPHSDVPGYFPLGNAQQS